MLSPAPAYAPTSASVRTRTIPRYRVGRTARGTRPGGDDIDDSVLLVRDLRSVTMGESLLIPLLDTC